MLLLKLIPQSDARLRLIKVHFIHFRLMHIPIPYHTRLKVYICERLIIHIVLLHECKQILVAAFGHRAELVVVPVLVVYVLDMELRLLIAIHLVVNVRAILAHKDAILDQ